MRTSFRSNQFKQIIEPIDRRVRKYGDSAKRPNDKETPLPRVRKRNKRSKKVLDVMTLLMTFLNGPGASNLRMARTPRLGLLSCYCLESGQPNSEGGGDYTVTWRKRDCGIRCTKASSRRIAGQGQGPFFRSRRFIKRFCILKLGKCVDLSCY